MKKKSLLLILLMTLLAPWAANAQATLPIGTGTSYSSSGSSATGSGSAMGNCYNYYSTSQFIYTAEELGGALTINSIAFNHNAYSMSSTVNIYLAHTTASTVDVNNPATEGTLVSTLSGSTIGGSAAEWQTFNFSTPFEYNGTDNLLVVVCRTKYNSGWSNSLGWQYTATSDNKFMTRNSDSSGYDDITNTSYSYTAYANRPNVIIGYVPTTPYISLDPTSETVFVGLSKTITATYGNVSGTPTITYSSSNAEIASVSGSGTSATVTGESVGTATITATMNGTYTATCAVTVEEPSYCKPSFSNTSDYIKSFTTTGGEQNIDNQNTGQGTGGYSNFYDTHFVSAEPETEIGFSVVRGYDDNYNYAIWVDWNKDYEFDNTTEKVAYTTSSTGDWTGSFTIPAATAAGDYHMRVLQVYSSAATPCVSASFGEGEDYKLTVLAANPYQKPVNLQVSALTAITATITWEAPNTDVQSYKYQYREEGGTWNALTSTTALSAPLAGLTGNTTYEFQVQAIYAGNNESAFASKSFTTPCAAFPIDYEYGFEDENEFNCWTTKNLVDGYDQIWSNNDLNSAMSTTGIMYSHTGDNSFFFFYIDYPDTNPDYKTIISPELSGTANGLHVEFYYRTSGSYPETFRVGYSTTNNQLSSFTWGTETTSESADYQLFKANYPAGTKYIAVQYTSDDKYFLLLDDFLFEEAASCLEPSDVLVSNITTETAIVTWTNGGEETAWDIYVTDDSTDVPDDTTTPTVANTATKPYPLTGLTPATTHYVYVRAKCSDNSAWSVPAVFNTECIDESLPYSYNFDNPAQFDICWNVINTNTSYNHVNLMDLTTTNKCLAFYYGTYVEATEAAVLPEFDGVYALNEYEITFDACYANTSSTSMTAGKLRVGIMTDPDDITTFTLVKEIDITNGYNTWESFIVRLNSYTGSGHYIAIQNIRTANGYVLVDNIEINHLPSCIEPENLAVSAETAHGATFAWTAGGAETAWHLYISETDVDPADDIALTEVIVADINPFTMTTGLDPETDYYVWVRASCGGTDGNSSWVGPETFTTDIACPAPTGLAASEITNHTAKLSWTGTSESYILSVGTYDYTGTPVIGTILEEDFEDGAMQGWTTISNDNDSNAWSIQSGSSYAHESNYCVRARYTSSSVGGDANDWLISPQIAFGGNISFYAKRGSSDLDKIQVYVSTTGNNISDFTAITEEITLKTTYEYFEYDLSSYSGNGYVAIVYTAPNDQFYVYVDDITITGPTYPIAWDTYNTTDTQKTVGGFDPETQYFAKVKGNCGSEGYSQETAVISFTTDIPCPAPTGFDYSNIKSATVDLSWNNDSYATEWEVWYSSKFDGEHTISIDETEVTIEGDLITYVLGGLTPETDYEVKMRANCGSGDGFSEWSSQLAFKTIAACTALNPVVSDITHHTATVNFEGESTTGFTVNYREAASIDGTNEKFDGTEIPSNWTKWTGLVDNVIAGTTTLGSTTSGWTMTTNTPNIFNSNHITLNIYGSSRYHWLVTPEVNLAANSGLSFDLALTAYANGGVGTSPVSGTCADDRFVVLIYANGKWEILREWNNSGSAYVYNDIATAGENVQIDLSSYSGTVKIAFYGESTVAVTGDDNDMHIDNVAIGVPVPAGDWQTKATATTTADLTGLTAGQKYEVKVVPICDPTQESDIVSFTTVSPDSKWFITAGEWDAAANWEPTGAPTIDQTVTLFANVTIESGCVAEAKSITQGTYTITIEDGGQLKHNNSNVTATVKKHITGYGAGNTDTKLGYNLISNPLSTSISTTSTPNISSTNILTGEYDFYSWDNTKPNNEWRNYKASPFTMTVSNYNLYGYLYSNEDDVDLTFTGTIKPSNGYIYKSVSYSSTYPMGGWHLLGNPFVCDAYLVDASTAGTALPYYKMNDTGDDLVPVTNGAAIAPMQGVFYGIESGSATVYMVRTAPVPMTSAGNLNINIAQNVNSRDAVAAYDRAIVRFDGGQQLSKFNLRENSTKVYIPQNNSDYAVVSAEASGMLPVNVNVATTGSYTISFDAEDINFTYLHLIDKLTGDDVDLLVSGSYTFIASPRDDANRFTIVFNSIDGNIDTTSDIFAYQNGNEIIVAGEGELQIFDVMGRFVTSMKINGSKSINASAYANGVYVFRLVGNDVKTQKIVVK